MAQIREVIGKEREVVDGQRKVRDDKGAERFDDKFATGVSISGGGIRSASFSMGALEAFNAHRLLEKIDYLSTVSGGGYTGSSLTWFNYLARGDKDWYFPFGRQQEGTRDEHSSLPNKILGYIRQHGNYLVPGFGITLGSIVLTVFRNTLLPLTVYLSLLVAIFIGLGTVQHGLCHPHNITGLPCDRLLVAPAWLAVVAALAIVILSFVYAVYTFIYRANYRVRTILQIALGMLGALTVLSAMVAILPLVKHWAGLAWSSSGGLVGIAAGLWHFYRDAMGKSNRGSMLNLGFIVAAALLIFALLVIAYAISLETPSWWAAYLSVGVGFGFFVNLNLFGLGTMYRDRIMETFMPDLETVEKGRWSLAKGADTQRLCEVCTAEDQGPYHLINCNLVLVDSEVSKYRGRGGDNFILSSRYCGSDATEWVETERFDDGDMTLASAMAISGAAANPHTGANGEGPTRNRFVSFLMFLLGLRLGQFVRNPCKPGPLYLRPNYLYPGIYQGLLGLGFNAHRRFLELTDGGHFENTATYELIRRRLDLILVSEAGADPDFSFSDLANLVERVRVDFGVYIRFEEDYDLRYVMPGSTDAESFFSARYDMAKRGFALGRIRYPETGSEPAKEGLFIYLKATMVKNLPADLYGYKDAHSSFPNQPTSDQFFDEMQLESYRELGYQLADDMLKDPEVKTRLKRFNQPAAD